MTTEEIIAIISEQAGKTFDIAFQRELMTRVTLWRARLLRDSLQRHIQDRRFYRQTIYCDLKAVSEPETTLSTKEKFKIKRTTVKIPPLIRANNILFDYVGDFKRQHPMGYMDLGRLAYIGHNQYGKLHKFGFLGDYVYVFSDHEVDEVAIEAIFADPRDLVSFYDQDNKPCYRDAHYPLDAGLAQLIAEYITRDLNRVNGNDQEITLDNESKNQEVQS